MKKALFITTAVVILLAGTVYFFAMDPAAREESAGHPEPASAKTRAWDPGPGKIEDTVYLPEVREENRGTEAETETAGIQPEAKTENAAEKEAPAGDETGSEPGSTTGQDEYNDTSEGGVPAEDAARTGEEPRQPSGTENALPVTVALAEIHDEPQVIPAGKPAGQAAGKSTDPSLIPELALKPKKLTAPASIEKSLVEKFEPVAPAEKNGIMTSGVRKSDADLDLRKNEYLIGLEKKYGPDYLIIYPYGAEYSRFGDVEKSFSTLDLTLFIDEGYWRFEFGSFNKDAERLVFHDLLKALTADADLIYKKTVELWEDPVDIKTAISQNKMKAWQQAGNTVYMFDTTLSGKILLKIKF